MTEKNQQEPLGIRAAGAVLFRRGSGGVVEFLLLRNRVHGTWAPPKGHLDPGEGPIEGARRELAEEIGSGAEVRFLDGFQEEVAYAVEVEGRARSKQVTYFLAALESGPVTLSQEHEGLLWAGLEGAMERLAHEDLRGLLRRADSFLREGG